MKLGNVYKIASEKETVVGIVIKLTESTLSTQDTVVTVITSNGADKRFYLSEIKYSSTRLKPEIREAFKKVYTQYQEEEKLKKEMREIEDKVRKSREKRNEVIDNLREQTDDFNIHELFNMFYEINNACYDPTKYSVGFTMQHLLSAGRSSLSYPFVSEEYDGSLYIHSSEEDGKKYGIKLPSAELQKLKKLSLKCMKLSQTSDHFESGDDRRLFAIKIFTFTFKKNCKHSEAVADCKKIQKWIQEQQTKLREY